MKKTSLLLAALLLAQNVKAPEPEPKMSFAEGICAGVFLGAFCGMAVFLVWKCASLVPPPPNSDTNPPSWTVPSPEPPTNNLPTNAPPVRIPVLNSGNSGISYDLGGGVRGYLATVQGSDDLKEWTTLVHVQGYVTASSQSWMAWTPDWKPLATGSERLEVTLTNRFYRTILP